MTLPLVVELSPPPDPAACLFRFRSLPYCLVLDSARRQPHLGRYSFLMADPVRVVRRENLAQNDGLTVKTDNLFTFAAKLLDEFFADRVDPAKSDIRRVVPFQGGLAGLLSYDLNRTLEQLPAPVHDEFQLPLAVLGLYDVVLAWDHMANQAWLISNGWQAAGGSADLQLAQERLEWFQSILRGEQLAITTSTTWKQKTLVRPQLAANELDIRFQPSSAQTIYSNFSPAEYCQAVAQAIEYIRAGEIFQVNLAQRMLASVSESPCALYARLRDCNPATFAAYFDAGEVQIISASPERFLQVRSGQVEARPIKGTRPRAPWPEADLFAGDDLLASDKDRAENVMIVDLLRNDLSRVCLPESVRVTELCRLELYEYVQHLVSVVRGELAQPRQAWELLRAAWPGGSITGAPKVRAMEIITELERVARGPYCGSILYAEPGGNIDANLLIRTLIVSRGWAQFPVGGGITTASDPATEYAETWHKADGLLRALTAA